MHAGGFGLGQHPQYPVPQYPQHVPGPPPQQQQFQQQQQQQGGDPAVLAAQSGMTDPAQLQQLVQLLGAKMLPKQTAVVECPKSMVGRVIGKGGETIKSLQQYTGAMIQVGGRVVLESQSPLHVIEGGNLLHASH